MKIGLARDEYRTLVDMLYIADWVMNAYKMGEGPPTDEYARLEQKIYALAERMGCQDLVEYDDSHQEYFPAGQVEDGPASLFIAAYDNDTFWDELLERLVRRDMVRLVGKERLKQMTLGERLEAEKPLREKYATEFEKKGIDRVEVMTFLPD